MDLNGVYQHQTPVRTFSGHERFIWTIGYENGMLYSGSQDKQLFRWDVAKGELRTDMPQSSAAIISLVIDNDWLFYSVEHTVVAYHVLGQQTSYVAAAPVASKALVLCFLVDRPEPTSQECTLYVGYSDGMVRVWRNGSLVKTLSQHHGPVKVMYKVAHALFTGSEDMSVVRFNVNTGRPTVLYQGFSGAIRALLSYQKNIYFSDGPNVRAQSIETGECVHSMTGHRDQIFCLLRAGDLLFSGSGDHTVIVRNIITAAPYAVLKAHTDVVKCLAVGDGLLFSGSKDATIRVWDLYDVFSKANVPMPKLMEWTSKPNARVRLPPASVNTMAQTAGYQSFDPVAAGVKAPVQANSYSHIPGLPGADSYNNLPTPPVGAGLPRESAAPSDYGSLPVTELSASGGTPGGGSGAKVPYAVVPKLAQARDGATPGAAPGAKVPGGYGSIPIPGDLRGSGPGTGSPALGPGYGSVPRPNAPMGASGGGAGGGGYGALPEGTQTGGGAVASGANPAGYGALPNNFGNNGNYGNPMLAANSADYAVLPDHRQTPAASSNYSVTPQMPAASQYDAISPEYQKKANGNADADEFPEIGVYPTAEEAAENPGGYQNQIDDEYRK